MARTREHYLLTVTLGPGEHLHAFLLCDDKRYMLDAGQRLVAEAEKLGSLPSTVLATPLAGDADVVRKILCARSAEAARLLATATDYHLSIFPTCEAEPADRLLMSLH